MSSPRHSPPPSAAAPKPKGILKNAGERRPSQGEALTQDDEANRLQWDESNLTLHEIQREQQEARMKIDEPKTPFVHGTALGPVGDDDLFDLDGAAPTAGGSRRGSAADQLVANTTANAGRAPGEGLGLAVGLDAAELAKGNTASHSTAAEGGKVRPSSARSTSRSPSFSLPPKSPSSRRSSSRSATAAAADDQRSDVRQQAHEMQVDDQDDGQVEEEEVDPETQAKHAAFAAKRNQHYGNEAEAMKIAAALAAQDDDEDQDDDEAGLPPVSSTSSVNGAAAR